MRRILNHSTMICSICCLCIPHFIFAQLSSDKLQEHLRNRVEAAGIPPKIIVGEDLIYSSAMLPIFYELRAYWPAWCNEKGPLPQAHVLIAAIKKADQEGLTPQDYHCVKIETLINNVKQNHLNKKPPSLDRLVDIDILLTDAFLIYASHLLAGRINPETIDPEWRANRREADLAETLQKALESNEIESALYRLLPPQPGYARLKEALVRYRGIVARGGWNVVPDGPKMEKGQQGDRVRLLRERLIAEGELKDTPDDEHDVYDSSLEQAIRRFQKSCGLDVDGIVGSTTRAALNISAEERVRQIEVNLERWRWLPQELGKRYILINIANFELDVVEDNNPVLTMKIIVGRAYRRTPVFSDKMTYLVLNPYWYVPKKIAVQDIVPLVRKDVEYFAKQNIKIFKGAGANAVQIDPGTIDWATITDQNFVYTFRQEPSRLNALGRIKFMFPNKYNVYIHDTPARELFVKVERGFSSGCIRIEKPIELAEYVLRSDPQWTKERILSAIQRGAEQTVRLKEPLPVHLLYWTAWVEEDGAVQFRSDIYERDKLLDEALREKPPKP